MKQYEVIDNFLDDVSFNVIKNVMSSPSFPWYYNDAVITDELTGLNQYQLTHSFFIDHKVVSDYFDLLNPLITKINPISLMRIKANLNPRTEERFVHGYHSDYLTAPKNQKTAVYYLNNNDGVTIFEDGTTIDSLENRLLVFDTPLLHTGTTCTDVNRRMVINLNYITNS
jgi:hypothetical protein